jgi:Helix-turn-helix domain
MSLKTLAHVWTHAQARGNHLLVLLAIADNANDDGIAYPSIKTLAKKTRTTPRTVKRLVRQLEAQGLLTIATGAGPRGSNLYQVVGVSVATSCTLVPGVGSDTRGVSRGQKGVLPATPKPSENQDISPEISERILKRLGLTEGSEAWVAALNGKQTH